ncbi:ATP-binding protein [Clostridium beijerinckii]|nr:ATP-binding protein [Clostridium beijerinckii]
MIIYEATKDEFMEHVTEDTIVTCINDNFIKMMGKRTSQHEMDSWNNSLQYMYKVLNTDAIPNNCGVAIEYKIPATSRRVDFMLTGLDADDRNNIIIFELKQWQEAEAVKDKDGLVMTFLGGSIRETTHPSYQAWSYASLIEDYNDAVEKNNLLLHPCAYLHNYSKLEKNDPIIDEIYDEYTSKAPVFGKGEIGDLRKFITKYIKKADNKEGLYKIEQGKIRPSKSLQDALAMMLDGNQEFKMIDDQKVVYETILKNSKRDVENGKHHVFIVEGGPGTGKSVLAINLLVKLSGYEYVCQYVTKNAAPRQVYHQKLKGKYKKKDIENLFKGSGVYTESEVDEFDVLIVDEAHRLNEKSGMFKNKGENQMKEIINSSKVSVFFIDEYQKVTTSDIGNKADIIKFAEEKGAKVTELKLESQFRCSGSDGYLAWIDDVLEIRSTANFDGYDFDYDFRIVDDPNEMAELIEEKNKERNKARIISGYCWNWITKKGGKDAAEYDIDIPEHNFKMKWNFSNSSTWAIDESSVSESGCIHTCQGLEFDYVGVIIGDDLRFQDERLITDFTRRASTDKSLSGIKGMHKKEPKIAAEIADEIIRNTYRTLITRGMKGCYVYCTDKGLSSYLKDRIYRIKK